MTAHYLSHSTYPLKTGDSCLIHAAAGGTGLLLVQMAKMRGARVIGTVGTEEKAKQAKDAGADEVVVYTKEDFTTRAKGMHVVYDSVGKATFMQSLDCLRPRGLMVTFGNASGAVPDFPPLLLSQKGSLFLTRPSLAHYAATPEEVAWRAGDVFNWVAQGKLKVHSTRSTVSPTQPRRIATWKAARPRESYCWSRDSLQRTESRRPAGLRTSQHPVSHGFTGDNA